MSVQRKIMMTLLGTAALAMTASAGFAIDSRLTEQKCEEVGVEAGWPQYAVICDGTPKLVHPAPAAEKDAILAVALTAMVEGKGVTLGMYDGHVAAIGLYNDVYSGSN